MRSILTIMAIESLAPNVRTVAEVNNPRHVEHFLRARVDEVLVTSKLASHLLARTALYPGLTSLVTDIVSGGEGSELYRIVAAREYLGLSVDEASAAAQGTPGDADGHQPRQTQSTPRRSSCCRPVMTRWSSPSHWGPSRRSRSRT